MTVLSEATLSPLEREVVDAFVRGLTERFGQNLIAVWLYGSRARGEEPGPESDVDLLVLTESGRHDSREVGDLIYAAAAGLSANPFLFAPYVGDPDWLRRRRQIKSFFIEEVDRDKIVLYERP